MIYRAPVDALASGDLRIDVASADGGAVVCTWTGKSNDRSPQLVLGPWFETLLAAKPPRIEMHFEKLDHFNSSTITVIIQFIQEARKRGVQLVMVYNQALKWQKLSFDALRVFAKDAAFELRAM